MRILKVIVFLCHLIVSTFCGVVASILGLTAADSSFIGSSLASVASVSDDAAAAAAATAAAPVTSSLSFWFSCLKRQENENDSPWAKSLPRVFAQLDDILWEEPTILSESNLANRKLWNNPPWKVKVWNKIQHPRQSENCVGCRYAHFIRGLSHNTLKNVMTNNIVSQ